MHARRECIIVWGRTMPRVFSATRILIRILIFLFRSCHRQRKGRSHRVARYAVHEFSWRRETLAMRPTCPYRFLICRSPEWYRECITMALHIQELSDVHGGVMQFRFIGPQRSPKVSQSASTAFFEPSWRYDDRQMDCWRLADKSFAELQDEMTQMNRATVTPM